jgi:hypothetical protein
MKKGLGKEDMMHKNFGGLLRQYQAYGRLDCEWFSYDASGEYRKQTTGALLKAKGLAPGKSDYEFKKLKNDTMHHIYIEMKAGKGKQSEYQKKFEETCRDSVNNTYYLAYSVEEAIKILEKEKILIV